MEPFVELKTNGLHLMRIGLWLMAICGIFYIFILVYIDSTDLNIEIGDAMIYGNIVFLLLVFIIVGLAIFLIGTYIQMNNVVKSVKACQRTILMNDLRRTRTDSHEQGPMP